MNMFSSFTSCFRHRAFKILFVQFLALFSFAQLHAQLIVNEVSQGASGTKEYVELLTVGTPGCSSIPCVDLRGWYIDDNNGIHASGSGTGIASGCIRFTNDPTWACVPIGTLIVVYNDGDINVSIPAQDLSMSDGNCRLIIPVSNCALIEKNIAQPSTATSVYPTTGFTPCGTWSPLGMSNSDDSFQTLNPSGTLVHSVSWGNNTANPVIYFAGASGGMVACMLNTTDNNPNLQANWSRLPVSGNETPGSANNAANAAWISSMNNNCTALIPLTVSATPGPPTCSCNGTATASASGSVGPYTYSWAPSGGTNATATGLCAGAYTVTVTSGAGCTATEEVIISPSPSLTLTITSTAVSCSGGTNGSATVTATGGTGNYTYNWTSGGTAATETGLAAGTYTVSVTDAGGCSGILPITITAPAPLAVAATQNNVGCNGNSSGSATVTVSGGTGPYMYSWAPSGGTNATATNLAAGTYTCTVTDFHGCIITQSFAITQPLPFSVTSTSNPATCGNSNGSATVTVSGGTPSYAYSWAPTGGNNATASNLPAGNYTVSITDVNSCTSVVTVNVANTAGPTAMIASSGNISCFGGSNGTATANVTGGNPSYTYQWTPSGGTSTTASGLTAGTYTFTVTDGNNCISTTVVTLTSPPALTASATSANASCNASNGSATVTASGGVSGYTYNWLPSGGNAATATGLPAGIYTCTITDANGCSITVSTTVNNSSGSSVTSTTSSVLCAGGATGSATAIANGGTAPYTYQWSPVGGTNATATGLSAGNYTVTVTDNNGCVNSINVTVTEPSQLSAAINSTPASCTGNNGTATANTTGGTPNYTYNWSPSGGTNATATNLAPGNYSVTITDQNGCSITQSVLITQSAAISSTVSSTNASCFGGSNATATITPSTGNPPFTYSWSSGGTAATETGLAAGTYTVVITDNSGCTVSQTVTITQPAALTATATSTGLLCNGNNNGTATVAANGGTPGYSYAWSPAGGNNATANGLAAGNYTATITDANGCITTQTVSVTQPGAISITASQTNVLCNGGSTGTAAVVVNGGTPGYTYSWSPSGGTNATASSLSAGTYTDTVTDANGCTSTQIITLTQPAAVNAVTTGDNSCAGMQAQISVAGAGGVAPYSYLWSNNTTAAIQNVTVSATTTFTVLVTDANGCSNTANATVNSIPAPVATISSNAVNGYFNLATGNELCFTDASQGSVSWNWNINGTPFSGQSPSCIQLTGADSGEFCVQLAVENAAGCRDSSETCIRIGDVFLAVPNVFTPNGDGTNDLFLISSRGLSELHVDIYDRWGMLINTISTAGEGWDGRSTSGMEASAGTYYYALTATGLDGKTYNQNGFVSLLR